MSLPRGRVTLLFSDIEGSTDLIQHLGETRWADVLEVYRASVRAVFSTHGGYEVDTQGDSFFAVFPSAREACRAAAAIQKDARAEPWASLPVRTRIGVHTGEPLVTGDHYVGIDVHRAARVMNAGHGGQTLLTEATARELSRQPIRGVEVRDLGAHRLKDLAEPQRLGDDRSGAGGEPRVRLSRIQRLPAHPLTIQPIAWRGHGRIGLSECDDYRPKVDPPSVTALALDPRGVDAQDMMSR